MAQWAKEKKLKWQRETRHRRAKLGFCVNHENIPAVLGRIRCRECLEKKRKQVNAKRLALKIETMAAYGTFCSCCGEGRIEFLSLEHTQGDGAKQRRETGGAGIWFYIWLKKRGFPQNLGLTVHCFNCNCAKGQYGYCPHTKEKYGGEKSSD